MWHIRIDFIHIVLLHCRNSEVLVPHIFQFLVMLSYEKYHSKPIIDMPTIIHRCDGIMASGMQPDTHGQFVQPDRYTWSVCAARYI